jgi:hypothetical protein
MCSGKRFIKTLTRRRQELWALAWLFSFWKGACSTQRGGKKDKEIVMIVCEFGAIGSRLERFIGARRRIARNDVHIRAGEPEKCEGKFLRIPESKIEVTH